MKKLIIGLTVIFLLLISISCVGALERAPVPQPVPPPAAVLREAVPAPTSAPSPQVLAEKGQPGEVDRMIVRSGQIAIVVEEEGLERRTVSGISDFSMID